MVLALSECRNKVAHNGLGIAAGGASVFCQPGTAAWLCNIVDIKN
jgi:hypothetical protein